MNLKHFLTKFRVYFVTYIPLVLLCLIYTTILAFLIRFFSGSNYTKSKQSTIFSLSTVNTTAANTTSTLETTIQTESKFQTTEINDDYTS